MKAGQIKFEVFKKIFRNIIEIAYILFELRDLTFCYLKTVFIIIF